MSPLGAWKIREVFYRKDRVFKPKTQLFVSEISESDGWCDDPNAPEYYNRKVKLPFPHRHEKLWREDHVYDIVVVLGYNDDPPVPGHGSAIFMHLKRGDYEGTEGCVALAMDDLLAVLKDAKPGDVVRISTKD